MMNKNHKKMILWTINKVNNKLMMMKNIYKMDL